MVLLLFLKESYFVRRSDGAGGSGASGLNEGVGPLGWPFGSAVVSGFFSLDKVIILFFTYLNI